MSLRSRVFGSVALGITCLATGCATSPPQSRQVAAPMSADPQAAAQQAAESAALTWLGLLDARKYTESWNAASMLFRNYRWSQSSWRSTIDWDRTRLGPLQWRRLQSTVFAQSIPGDTPESRWLAGRKGEYVILKFSSSYQFNVTETVIVMKDSDAIWRVADYYIAYAK